MIKALLDPNVIVAAFPARYGTLAEITQHWTQAHFEMAVSEHLLGEVRRA